MMRFIVFDKKHVNVADMLSSTILITFISMAEHIVSK